MAFCLSSKRRTAMRTLSCLFAAGLLLSTKASPQFVDAKPPTQGVVYGANGSFDTPDKLSVGVVNALMATKAARQTRAFMQLNHDSDASQYFMGKKIDLVATDKNDYVVLSKIPGADCLQFWLVRDFGQHSQAVLATSGTTLTVLPDDHKGLRDVRVDWWAGNGNGWADVYRFNGTRYFRFQRFDTYWELKGGDSTTASSWILTKSSLERTSIH